jgi:hypothetical protein
MSEQNKIDEIKAEAEKKLFEHLGFDGVDGTYIYCLTRVKEAFHVGTMTLDDFVEVDGDFVAELADMFVEMTKPLLAEIERKDEALRFYENSKNYEQEKCLFDGNENDVYYEAPEIMLDLGQRAREAL